MLKHRKHRHSAYAVTVPLSVRKECTGRAQNLGLRIQGPRAEWNGHRRFTAGLTFTTTLLRPCHISPATFGIRCYVRESLLISNTSPMTSRIYLHQAMGKLYSLMCTQFKVSSASSLVRSPKLLFANSATCLQPQGPQTPQLTYRHFR